VLAKYYIEALGIAKESSDAQKLLNYRAPSAAKQVQGLFVYFLCANEELTIVSIAR